LEAGIDRDGLPAGEPGFYFRLRQRIFFSRVHTFFEAHPASYTVGTCGFFPGVKAAGREADYSPSCSTEVKNGGAITPLLHIL
jgi:hypothetical protein